MGGKGAVRLGREVAAAAVQRGAIIVDAIDPPLKQV
jgi:hypothetical protein